MSGARVLGQRLVAEVEVEGIADVSNAVLLKGSSFTTWTFG